MPISNAAGHAAVCTVALMDLVRRKAIRTLSRMVFILQSQKLSDRALRLCSARAVSTLSISKRIVGRRITLALRLNAERAVSPRGRPCPPPLAWRPPNELNAGRFFGVPQKRNPVRLKRGPQPLKGSGFTAGDLVLTFETLDGRKADPRLMRELCGRPT